MSILWEANLIIRASGGTQHNYQDEGKTMNRQEQTKKIKKQIEKLQAELKALEVWDLSTARPFSAQEHVNLTAQLLPTKLLLKRVFQIQGDYRGNYYVYYNKSSRTWKSSQHSHNLEIGSVMLKETAIQIAEELNSSYLQPIIDAIGAIK